jgi:hypothetical protein
MADLGFISVRGDLVCMGCMDVLWYGWHRKEDGGVIDEDVRHHIDEGWREVLWVKKARRRKLQKKAKEEEKDQF